MTSIPVSRELQAVLARQGRHRPQLTQDSLFSTGGGGGLAHQENASAGLKNSRAAPLGKPPSFRRRSALERFEALCDSLAKEKAGLDGTGKPFRRRYRSGAGHLEPPSNNVNVFRRTMLFRDVEALERNSHKRRGKGRTNGLLGKVGVALMRAILFVLDKSDNGRVYPSYATLARLAQYSERAIIYAMKKLERYGFITIIRRCKWIETPYGRRLVQDSNCYQYHLPKTAEGRLALAVFVKRPSSDCTRCAGVDTPRIHNDAKENLAAEERWWLVEPIPLGDGGFI
jgi:hypothetical protein